MEVRFRHWIKKLKKVIATFYLTILTFFSLCEISLRVDIMQLWEKKKSELWDIKVAITFLILYSVAETGFHKYQPSSVANLN